MDEIKQKNLNKAAQILLMLLLINIVAQLSVFYQTKFVLDSVIIPEDTSFKVSESHIFNAFACSVGSVAALLCYFFKRPIISCILALIAMAIGQSYFLLFK